MNRAHLWRVAGGKVKEEEEEDDDDDDDDDSISKQGCETQRGRYFFASTCVIEALLFELSHVISAKRSCTEYPFRFSFFPRPPFPPPPPPKESLFLASEQGWEPGRG